MGWEREKPKAVKVKGSPEMMRIMLIRGGRKREERINSRVIWKGAPAVLGY